MTGVATVYGGGSFPAYTINPQEGDVITYDGGLFHNLPANSKTGITVTTATPGLSGNGTPSAPLSFSSTGLQNALPWSNPSDMLYYNSGVQVLAHGTVGQILASTGSGSQYAPNWQSFSSLSPLTTKGDTLVFDTFADRLPVGNNSDPFMPDSTSSFGVAYHPLFPYHTIGSYPYGSGTSSMWYTAQNNAALSSVSVNTGQGYAIPVQIHRACTIDALGFSCNASGTATAVRCALYADLGSTTPNWPGNLLGQFTTGITPTSSTFCFTTLPTAVTVTPGLYWLAIQSNASDNTFTVFGGNPGLADNSIMGYVPVTSITNAINGAQKNITYGAFASPWPNPYGTAGGLIATATPFVFYHCSA
jgi:hypothetical protein